MSVHKHTQFSGKLLRVKLSDLDEIARIEQDCFDAALRWTNEEFAPYFEKPQSLSTIFSMAVLPAKKTSQKIYAGYSLASIEEGNTGTILSIAVRQSFRGQGLGFLMLENLYKNLMRKKVTTIDLQVEDTNLAAIKLYRDFGFIETGRLPDYYAPGRHGLQMELVKD